MICAVCEREVCAVHCALNPAGECSGCFNVEAYRRKPVGFVRNGDVDREKMLAKKREYARRRKERMRSMGLTGKGKPRCGRGRKSEVGSRRLDHDGIT